jgi:hypothetical protein
MKMNDKRKFVVAPKNRAPRSGRQNLLSVGKRAVGTRQTCGRATFLKHPKADVNASIIAKRTDTQWNAWLDEVKEFCKPSRARALANSFLLSSWFRLVVMPRIRNSYVSSSASKCLTLNCSSILTKTHRDSTGR